MKEKALLILSPGFPANTEDSTCLPPVQQFVLAVKANYPELTIIVLAFQYPFKKTEYLWHGIKVIAFGGQNKNKLWKLPLWLSVYKKMRTLHKTQKIIGVLSLWLNECALVGNYFTKLNHLKHYMWLHGQDAKANNRYLPFIRPKGAQVIAISDFIKKEFYRNHNIMPFLVVENGASVSSYPELEKLNRPIDIFGVGSLIPLKNYSVFIDLINGVRTLFPNVSAVIAGTGQETDMLQKKINDLQLQNNIRLAGLQAHNNILKLMNQSKIFLHTSDYEGNSTVLIEALYSGCAVVSTCALSPSPVENIFVTQDYQAMKQHLIALLSNNSMAVKRVLFNDINRSAKMIGNLFLQ